MNNPFEVIEARLSSIENLILDLKHQPQKSEPTDQPERLLTIQEAAEFLSLTVPTMYSKASKGELPVMKRSKRLYFSRIELLNYLKYGSKKPNDKIQEIAKFNTDSKHLNYDSDWNNLIQVVRQIQMATVDEVDENQKTTVMNALLDLRIDDLFEAVYQFCKWYNDESKNIS